MSGRVSQVWGRSKFYTRRNCTDNYDNMMKDIPDSLLGDNLPLYFIREYIRRARDYMAIYHDAHKRGEMVEGSHLAKLKEEYKSHRRPSPLESMMKPKPCKPWAIKRMLVEGKLRQPCAASKFEAEVDRVLSEGVQEDEHLEVFDRPDDHSDDEDELEEQDEEAFDRGYEDE